MKRPSSTMNMGLIGKASAKGHKIPGPSAGMLVQGPSRQTLDWSGARSMGSPVPALSAREASCLCDALVRLYHLGMASAFRHVLYLQQSSTQALQHYDELQQRLPVSFRISFPLPATQCIPKPHQHCILLPAFSTAGDV